MSLSLVSVMCCQAEVSAKVRSLTQRSPTESGMSESVREASITRGSWSTRGIRAMGKKNIPCYVMTKREKEMWQGNRTRHPVQCTL